MNIKNNIKNNRKNIRLLIFDIDQSYCGFIGNLKGRMKFQTT
jgi:hypothetical protein